MPNRFTAAVAASAPSATKPFPLPGVRVGSDRDIVLHCRHFGFANPATSSAVLKASTERRKIAAIADDNERFLAGVRLDVKTLAPSIVGWENVLNPTPLEPTPELVDELLTALVEENVDLFVRWKMWVNDEDNFVAMPLGEAADLGK